ncbi:uncharacterized protein LOC143302190 isoform X3 [Babylonia areolata]|uniref:uncharacterized protein LOC143302190 isoform X3 n=1 Tax=Babylonia areolata TaxID=304850 RepID=UPI003FD02D4F
MKAVAVCLLLCCGVLVSAQEKTYEWENEVLDYMGESIPVAESTTVYPKKMMLMNASDPHLRKTPVYRSVSRHDFQAEVPEQERRPMVVVSRNDSRRKTGSKDLDKFCRGRKLLFVKDVPIDELPEPCIRFPPLLCIWGPVDIFFPIDTVSVLEKGVPTVIRKWRGPFAPFP